MAKVKKTNGDAPGCGIALTLVGFVFLIIISVIIALMISRQLDIAEIRILFDLI